MAVSNTQSQLYFVLHDQQKFRHFIAELQELTFPNKDNLKPGTFVTFNGKGDRSLRCKAVVVLSGTKERCETSLSAINKVNKTFIQDSDSESDSSADSLVKHIDDNENNDENFDDESENESQRNVTALLSNASRDALCKRGSTSAVSKATTSTVIADKEPVFRTAPTFPVVSDQVFNKTISRSCINVLGEISGNVGGSQKRKVLEEEFKTNNTTKKRLGSISHSMYDRLKRENDQLTKEIKMYRENWMSRPTGTAATYFIEIGKVLSGLSSDNDKDEDNGEKLERICMTLNMTETDLKACEHQIDITKTCRAIIKKIFVKSTDRATMLISSMDPDKLRAVQNYARMVHPAQAKVPNSFLNNAIGNVFASEKRSVERKNLEQRRFSGTIEETDDVTDPDDLY